MRAARALIGISQAELARRAGVSVPTIKRCESEGEKIPVVSSETQQKIRTVLEAAGIEFIPEDSDGGVGVRLRKTSPTK
ncbi:helix-turn-helix transcriptional regulator [Mesorhizobium sp. RMAD-H1]|uniref:helix-turn-helix domain-containing protein n=1 Tax=Mesorhizobium sp. RMAD-H1 TaxID=2587065 RepID=UPI00181E3EFE|nr:helix-turn-helix transcriptional regulator [Mesorhizobium sp. RMAD-H1]MBB2974283.1 transcriptional regulator with XRE-family HTH domain [Mesorhizobium sp. RMAD-H1]